MGRVTFGLFSRIEWGLAALSAMTVAFAGLPRLRTAAVAALVVMLALQALWLLPVLDDRVTAIIAGQYPPPSVHHTVYAGIEAAKACLLLALAVAGTWRAVAGR